MTNLIGVAAAVAVAVQGAAPSSVSLQPTGKWQVAFDDDLCAMSRDYGADLQAITLAFRPFPMNDRAEVALILPRGKVAQRTGPATVTFAPGKALTAEFNAFGTSDRRQRVVHVYLDRALLAELAGAQTVTITADGETRSFAIPKAPAALRVLDQCEVSLLKEWGVDPGLKTGALAKMVGAPGSYFGPDQYPSEALRSEQQGRVVALLSIDDKGAVSQCRVVKSSNAPPLDATTCRIARARLRFTAANDAAGRAISSHYLLPVRWALPN